jgi:uncharacterized glyoxalase superfamily protein PhnB
MTTQSDDPLDRRDKSSTQTLRLRSLSPALTVADVDASLVWYRDVVGFHVQEKWEHEGKVGGAALIAGLGPLLLVQDDWAQGRDRVKGVGFRLHMTTAHDVDELAAAIEQRGGKLDSPPADAPWGPRAFSLVDPDGYKITIASESSSEG